MKRIHILPLLILLSGIIFSSCGDKRFQTYTANVPVYMSYDDLRKAVVSDAPQDIVQPGKIYFKDNYIYINEFMEGIHVIDISDPSSPAPVSYITVPGAIDMAIKDNTLYVDSYTDLVLIDISDPENPVESDRIEDILEYTLPPYDTDYPLAEIDEDEGIVTGWQVKEYTQEIYSNPYPYPLYRGYAELDMMSSVSGTASPGGTTGTVYGVGGSMARFLTYDKYLYMLQSQSNLKVADISSTDTVKIAYDKYVGWGLETMFIHDGYMYLGSTNGMYILNLVDPENPFVTSIYSHITSCDPVVVNGDLAYVTLRSGNMCGGTANLLEVIDISDKNEPKLLKSYGMTEPYGLGISNNTLFVCQGDYGLFVYDATNPQQIGSNKIAEFNGITAKDVIPVNELLFAIGDDGFLIYDYSDLNDITQVGSILINQD